MADFLTELRERRILPALGVYAASCWVVVEILDRMAERTYFSPHIPDLVFWGLYSLLPAAALVAWSYGRPGKDKATTAQKIGVPINFVATGAMLFLLFGDKQLATTADLVEVVDEQGVQTEVLVPKAGTRQRLFLFFYDNDSGDEALDWFQYGATELLAQDLQQDPYLVAHSPYNGWGAGSYGRIKAAGYEDGLKVPTSLLREISRDANRQYFTEGTIEQNGDEIVLVTRLWDAESMRQVSEITQQGWDVYELLDKTSVAVREALDIPSLAIDGHEDIPLAETYGESEVALKRYIDALNTRLLSNDPAGAIAQLDETLAEDNNFVLAYFVKALLLAQSGNLPAAVPVLEQVQRLDFRLPSTDRAAVASLYYQATGQTDRLRDFLRVQLELRDDAGTHAQLAQMLMVDGELEEARYHFEQAIARDALNVSLYLPLADIARSSGAMDEAVAYARRFEAASPDDFRAKLKLGDLLRDTGELEAAAAEYRQATLLEQDSATPLLRLKQIAVRLGDREEAERLLEEAQRIAQTAAQRAEVHFSASNYAARYGLIDDAITQLRAAEPLIAEFQPPFVIALMVHNSLISNHLRRGDIPAAEAVLEEARSMVPEPPYSKFLEAYVVMIDTQRGRYEAARAALKEFDEVLKALNFEGIAFQVPMLDSVIEYMAGNYAEAARQMRIALTQMDQSFAAGDASGVGISFYLAQLADSETYAGELDEAEATIERGFRVDPNSPNLWASRARLEKARGNALAAKEAAETAIDLWRDADPGLIELIQVQELIGSLSLAGS